MKVIHILNELKFSGAEIMYASAAEEFQKLGCELYVVSTAQDIGEYAPHFKKAGYKVLHWPYKAKSLLHDLMYAKRASDFFKAHKIDVVHIHRSTMRLLMAYAAWKAGCKGVYTFHNVFPTKWYTRPYHIVQRWWAKNIFNCTFQTISDSVEQNEKDVFYNKTHKIYNWYDCNRFYPANQLEKTTLRKELGIDDETLVLISIGGCSHIKRHTDIISALPIILKEFPDLLYLHLGEGDMLGDEKRQAEEMALSKYIRFLGNQTDVRKFLVVSDLYLMPSKHEGIPITTIETLGCKIPTILYDVPGLRDFNKSGTCAKLIPENPTALANAVIELYKDENQQMSLAEKGKTLVDSQFYMPYNTKEIMKLYQS